MKSSNQNIYISNVVFFLVLLYPLLYAIPVISNISFRFSIYFFSVFLVGISTYNILELFHLNHKKQAKKISYVNLLLLISIFCIVLFNFTSYRYLKPLLFCTYLLNIYVFLDKKRVLITSNAYIIIFLYFLFSCIFLLNPNNFILEGRFIGFLGSPTVYSVYLEAIFIILYFVSPNKWQKWLLFIIGGVFVILTKTRINLLFLLLIPIFFQVANKSKKVKTIFTLLFVLAINSLYPLYNFIMNTSFVKEMIKARYKDGRDASFGLRYKLHNLGISQWLEGNWKERLFGQGTATSRLLVQKEFSVDIFIHNDFIRLLVDYGLVLTLIYLYFFYKNVKDTKLAYVLFLLYLFSFYHNMVYDFYLVSLVFIAIHFEKTKEIDVTL